MYSRVVQYGSVLVWLTDSLSLFPSSLPYQQYFPPPRRRGVMGHGWRRRRGGSAQASVTPSLTHKEIERVVAQGKACIRTDFEKAVISGQIVRLFLPFTSAYFMYYYLSTRYSSFQYELCASSRRTSAIVTPLRRRRAAAATHHGKFYPNTHTTNMLLHAQQTTLATFAPLLQALSVMHYGKLYQIMFRKNQQCA